MVSSLDFRGSGSPRESKGGVRIRFLHFFRVGEVGSSENFSVGVSGDQTSVHTVLGEQSARRLDTVRICRRRFTKEEVISS